eukprot:gene17807-biopygen13269
MWLPWGLRTGDGMELDSPEKGSIAADSEQLRGCVGMVLVSLNGFPVTDEGQCAALAADARTLELCFQDVTSGEEAGQAPVVLLGSARFF